MALWRWAWRGGLAGWCGTSSSCCSLWCEGVIVPSVSMLPASFLGCDNLRGKGGRPVGLPLFSESELSNERWCK